MRVHISLNTRSVDDSVNFYSRLFGQAASKTREGYANFRLDEPPIHLALVESEKPAGAGLSHLGIELPDSYALQAWRTRLQDEGVEFSVEDKASCCYATADKLWLNDPDGYRWEVWVRTGEYDSMGSTRGFPEVEDGSRKPAIASSCCGSTG
jgi:catechol-2,3-dioxygenase